MTQVMKGIRILEVAEYGFVPMAAALLADWGAEVVKIEPADRGDAARNITTAGDVNVFWHNCNRGKQSLGLDLSKPEGLEILYTLAKSADVFLTNKLGSVRRKLKIDIDDIRAQNPDIIYVIGGGQGERGPEADRGSFDLIGYWHRTGVSLASASPDGHVPFLPSPGFGDFTGSMFIAGGIMGALYHRKNTGEATTVDASLMATGMWGMNGAIAAAANDPEWTWPPTKGSPLSAIYKTKDGRWIAIACLQTTRLWPLLLEALGYPEHAADPRFLEFSSFFANTEAATQILTHAFACETLDVWRDRLKDFPGQWSVVQSAREVIDDPQVEPNGYLQTVHAENGSPFRVVTAPIQFNGTPAVAKRGPDFNEHGDAILADIGLDWDRVVDLKFRGIVA